MTWLICPFKDSLVDFVFILFCRNLFIYAHSVDPDHTGMLHSVESDLGLDCLPKFPLADARHIYDWANACYNIRNCV